MKRYILTGAPGAGKTSIIRALEAQGENVIHESASDIIYYKQNEGVSRPWQYPNFLEDIATLQRQRQIDSFSNTNCSQFYDRSPICTYALALYLGFDPTIYLLNELDRIKKNNIYQKEVFFIDNIGFIKNTNARKISFADSLKFEQIHVDTYSEFGYKCIHIPPLTIEKRVKLILTHIPNH